MKKTYFRSYGIHAVEPLDPGEPKDYIASFPNWRLAHEALKSNFPDDGNVITPEYATTPDGPLTWTENADLIKKHIDEAKQLTEDSEATLYLGTPFHTLLGHTKKPRWLNAVLAIRSGEVLSMTYKQNPLVVEEKYLGIEKPTLDQRKALGGNAVLICNELFLHTKNSEYALKDQPVRQIFSPSLWPIPVELPKDLDPDKVKVGDDDYYRRHLEERVATGVFAHMKTVERVIVSDLGIKNFPYPFHDIAPYNAVFDREN